MSAMVSADPVSRAGSLWQYINPWHRHLKQPFDDMKSVCRQFLLDFQEISMEPQVYITEGHYDDYREDVIEYVRRGGGLVIAGHAWETERMHVQDPPWQQDHLTLWDCLLSLCGGEEIFRGSHPDADDSKPFSSSPSCQVGAESHNE